MSRNFELLEQIEQELASGLDKNGTHKKALGSDEHKRAFTEHPAPIADSDLVNLVQCVFTSPSGHASHQVVFCGVDKENASSSVCARVAHTLISLTSENVCLVDVNPCSLELSNLVLTSSEYRGAIAGGDRHDGQVRVAEHLWVASMHSPVPGPTNHTANAWRSKMEQLTREFTYVLIDAPAISANANAVIFGQVSDGVILVVEAESTRRDTAAKTKQALETAGVRLLGTVLYNRSFPVPKGLYARL